MSEHITHIAVYEDCARIMNHAASRFTRVFHESIEEAYDCGFFCSGSRGNHLYAIPILEKNRELYKKGKLGTKEKEQIAGAIGWLTHRASDLQMKPLFRELEEQSHPLLPDNECQMYHDAISFINVYQRGQKPSKSPNEIIGHDLLTTGMKNNPASSQMDIDYIESVYTHYFMEKMLEQCVFTEKLEDIDQFTEKMINQGQDLYEDLRLYIRANENPTPFKMQGYINNYNVYDENDPLLKFVRYVQENNLPHPSIDLEEALNTANNQSQYAQALKKGYDFLGAASDFFEEKISKNEVYDAVQNFTPKHRI